MGSRYKKLVERVKAFLKGDVKEDPNLLIEVRDCGERAFMLGKLKVSDVMQEAYHKLYAKMYPPSEEDAFEWPTNYLGTQSKEILSGEPNAANYTANSLALEQFKKGG